MFSYAMLSLALATILSLAFLPMGSAISADPTLSLASDLAALGKDVFVLYSDKLDSNNDKGNVAMVDHRLLVKYLSDLDAPATVLDIASFPARFPPELGFDGVQCEDLLEEERVDILGGSKNTRGKTFVVFALDPGEVRDLLDAANATTVLGHCPLDIRVGVYNRDNVFLYVFTPPFSDPEAGEKAVMSEWMVQRHRYVGILKDSGRGHLLLTRYDIYHNRTKNAIWPAEEKVRSVLDLFPELPMDGYYFEVASLPYDAYVTNDNHPNPPDDTHMFVNHSGLEVNLVEMVGKSLGYTHGFSNSADQQWGAITDGEWNGMVKMVMEDKADFMISAVGRFLFRRKVLINTVGFIKTRLVFLSSKPARFRNYFVLVLPLGAPVWAAVVVSLAAIMMAMLFVAQREESLLGRRLRSWSTLRESSWYAFGTLIGESITRDTKSEGAWGLRLTIAVWILAAFLLTAGYGGNLRAFLLKPEFNEPIDTLEKVLDSGIQWEIGLYGEDVEVQMARSEHPTMKAIWDGKIPVINEAFAFQRMQQIVDGDRILIDWMNKLETSMYIGFTLSNGEKLMEYYYLPIVHSHVECVWGFNPFNPHVERFDKVIMSAVEADLVNEIHFMTRLWLKRKYGPDRPPQKKDDELVVPMQIADFIGLLAFFGLFTVFSIVCFCAESLVRRLGKRERPLVAEAQDEVMFRSSLSQF